MSCAALNLAVLVLFAGPAEARAEGLGEPRERIFEDSVEPDSAWDEPGFRVALRTGYERLIGQGKAPGASAFSLNVAPTFRLSPRFSLGANVRYSILIGSLWNGVRWSTTLDATLHPWRALELTLGAGFGGLVLKERYVDEYYDETSGTYYSPRPAPGQTTLRNCRGQGGVALARLGYLFVVGELFSTGPYLQADMQATRCHDVNDDTFTGDEQSVAEWWWQRSVLLSWAFAWR